MRILFISILLAITIYSQCQNSDSLKAEAYQFFKTKVGKKFKIKYESTLISGRPYAQIWKWRVDNVGVTVVKNDTLLCSVNLTCLSSKLKNHHVILMEAVEEYSLGLLELMREKTLEEIWADMPFEMIQSVE